MALSIFNLAFSSVRCHHSILRAHSRSRQEGGDAQSGGRHGCSAQGQLSPPLFCSIPWVSRECWLQSRLHPIFLSNQRPRACGPRRAWLAVRKFRRCQQTPEQIREGFPQGDLPHLYLTLRIFQKKKDLSRSGKRPQAAIPIQGEPHTPSSHGYLLTHAPDTTAVSDGEKVKRTQTDQAEPPQGLQR